MNKIKFENKINYNIIKEYSREFSFYEFHLKDKEK